MDENNTKRDFFGFKIDKKLVRTIGFALFFVFYGQYIAVPATNLAGMFKISGPELVAFFTKFVGFFWGNILVGLFGLFWLWILVFQPGLRE